MFTNLRNLPAPPNLPSIKKSSAPFNSSKASFAAAVVPSNVNVTAAPGTTKILYPFANSFNETVPSSTVLFCTITVTFQKQVLHNLPCWKA